SSVSVKRSTSVNMIAAARRPALVSDVIGLPLGPVIIAGATDTFSNAPERRRVRSLSLRAEERRLAGVRHPRLVELGVVAGARQRDELPFPGRKRHTAFVHRLVDALREPLDEVLDTDGTDGFPDLFVRRVRTAERDVVLDRPGEEERLLRNVPDLTTERRLR